MSRADLFGGGNGNQAAVDDHEGTKGKVFAMSHCFRGSTVFGAGDMWPDAFIIRLHIYPRVME